MKPLEAYAATCPNIPNIPKKYLASKMHSAKGAQVPLQLTSAALAPQVAAQGNLRLLTNQDSMNLNDIQWICNDINILFPNIARLKRLMLKCRFDIFILLLTLSCRNLWQNQLGKFWCGLTGWQLTLLGLKSAEGQTVRRKKQVAITRIV